MKAACVLIVTLAALGFAPGRAAPTPLSHCMTAQLRVSVVHSAAQGGTVGGYLAFRNRGPGVCTMHGWPTLTAVRPGASTTAVHVRETMFGPYTSVHGIQRYVRGVPTVVLRPGQSAVAAFTARDDGMTSAPCPPPWRQLRVTPPGDKASTLIPAWIAWYGRNLPDCTGIEVSMVVPPSGIPR